MITIPAPMLAPQRLHKPFTSPEWLYELKFDGYRCMAGIDGGRVELRTKSGADCTRWYPEIVDALGMVPGQHVIDGEVCVLVDGVSDFNRLQARGRSWKAGRDRVTLCAFDILVHDGRRVIDLPLVRRKALLAELLLWVPKQAVLYVKDLPADANLFASMTLPEDQGGLALPIEGVVAKRRASEYRPGIRSPDWLKIKRAGWDAGRVWKPGPTKKEPPPA